ncbi:MAG: hypothetical protein JW729_02135, partial [Bacteroidales bacterium]|nr:hypothetical protein [Bacteroidales bacterium]
MCLSAFKNWTFKILFLGVMLLFSMQSNAQQRVLSFPDEPASYFTTLEQHFSFAPKSKKKEVDAFLSDLKTKWQSGFFSEEIQKEIIRTSNDMLDSKMTAMPYFSDYFNTLINLLQNNQDQESIQAWMQAVHYFLAQNNYRDFTSFIRASDAFFKNYYVYYDRTLIWKAETNQYKIEFANDSLKYIFPKTDLVCITKGDSTNIYQTSGIYFPITNTWVGKGGKVSWERAGFPIDSVYAVLDKYSIPMLFAKYTADSVQFHNLNYFDKPLIGKMEEQVLASRRGAKAIFPKFISYEKRWQIPNLFPNIDFIGGVLVEGSQLRGFGDETNPASLTFNRNDTAFIKLHSNNFSIDPNQIRSDYASVSIHYKNDSIFHSGLHMNYTKDNQLLTFFRDSHGLTANPFYDTYHRLDMYVESAYWKIGENQISFDMAMGRTKSPARFESSNYFSEDRFLRLQGIDENNPLVNLKRYADENQSDIVYFDEYADYLRMPIEQVQLLLLQLAHQGFLLYDSP